MITTKGVDNSESSKKRVSPYIKPGIGKYKIVNISYVESKKGTKGFKFIFESEPFEELDGKPQVAEVTKWITEKSKPYFLSWLLDIADALKVREGIDAIESTEEDYPSELMPLIGNKYARWKFSGEEIETSNGRFFKAVSPLKYFVESLDVKEEDTTLSFDPSDPYDMVRLPDPDVEEMVTEKTGNDDLPF